MLFEHKCQLFMFIGIILIITGTILYIKNENDNKKALENRLLILRAQRLKRIQHTLAQKEKYKKIAHHKSKYFTKGKFSISPTTECVNQSDKDLAIGYKNECDILIGEGNDLTTVWSEFPNIIAMLEPVIKNLDEISKKLIEFNEYKTCDTYCPTEYPNSKYYSDENICKCENPYFNSNGICVKCESPNVWENGLCTPKCADKYIYNNGKCELDITDVNKFIADVTLLTNNIIGNTPYNYHTNPLLKEQLCKPNPYIGNTNPNGCNCGKSWDCDSNYCINATCQTNPNSL